MDDPIISQEWITSLEQFHLPRWEELPDFEIYMDQLITIVSQYVAIFQDKEGSMITASSQPIAYRFPLQKSVV